MVQRDFAVADLQSCPDALSFVFRQEFLKWFIEIKERLISMTCLSLWRAASCIDSLRLTSSLATGSLVCSLSHCKPRSLLALKHKCQAKILLLSLRPFRALRSSKGQRSSSPHPLALQFH